MKRRTIARDLSIAVLTFVWPFLIPVHGLFILPSIFTAMVVVLLIMTMEEWVPTLGTDWKIRWGFHECSDGHTLEHVSTDEDEIARRWVEKDGFHYEVVDIERYECENCYKETSERVNLREKVAEGVGVDWAVR